MRPDYRRISREILFAGPPIAMMRDTVQIPGSKQITRVVVEHPGAVVVLPLTAAQKIVAVRQYRYALDQEIIELPAGTLEKGEVPAECVRRELSEEVGLAAGRWDSLGTLWPAPGFCDEIQHLFLARDLSPFRSAGDEDEFIEPIELDVPAFEAMIARGEIGDAKSIAAFLRARLAGFL